jgi:hypothetical protein
MPKLQITKWLEDRARLRRELKALDAQWEKYKAGGDDDLLANFVPHKWEKGADGKWKKIPGGSPAQKYYSDRKAISRKLSFREDYDRIRHARGRDLSAFVQRRDAAVAQDKNRAGWSNVFGTIKPSSRPKGAFGRPSIREQAAATGSYK